MSTLKKLTWRESRFLVTLLLIHCVTKRMLTVPFNTPGSLGAKLLTASIALRPYKNRHLGSLMHCCEA